MNKLWLGVALLAILLLMGWIAGSALHRIHGELAQDLKKASEAAEVDFREAEALAQRAEKKWKESRRLASALADHEPLEEMDSLFAQLKVYGSGEHKTQYGAICADLSSLARAIGEEQCLFWWNLL